MELKEKISSLTEKKNSEDTEKIWLDEKVNSLMIELDA